MPTIYEEVNPGSIDPKILKEIMDHAESGSEEVDVQIFRAVKTKGEEMSANDKQVGGDHYSSKKIQVWDFIVSNDIGFLAGNAIKYLARYKDKNGEQDIRKAIHYCEKLLETEYKKD